MRDTQSPSGGAPNRYSRRGRALLAAAIIGIPGAAAVGLLGVAYWRSGGDARGTAKTVYRALRTASSGDGRAAAAMLSAAVSAPALPERAEAPLVVFADGLGEGWQDWSWATRDLNAGPGRGNKGKAVRVTQEAWKGLYLHHDAFSTDGFGSVRLFVKGQKGKLTLALADAGGKFLKQVPLESGSTYASRVADGWVEYRVPLTALGVGRTGSTISGLIVQDGTGQSLGDVFLDDIALLPDPSLAAAPTAATVAVTVEAGAKGSPISPLIYGMAFAPKDYVKDLRLSLNRWGGNDKSRYNWRHGNAVNAARDWRFANRVATTEVPADGGPSSAADWFVTNNVGAGAQTMLTIPAMGWVSKDTDNNNTSVGVPDGSGPPLRGADGAIKGYDPTANRAKTSVRSVARQKDAKAGEVAQDAWVRHLVSEFGPAKAGGVRFFAIDNEPDLWDATHTDVRPARMGYDDILSTFVTYASAVKDADPSAQVTGPVSWGWTGYFYSPLDRGDDNFKAAADRKRHGDEPFLPWFLKQVKAHDAKAGRRTLDVLDVHYYPQADLYNAKADRPTQERRLRSVRSLWDPAYQDESWIGQPVRLFPLLKGWVAAGYPGTKIGLTEWNFGGEADISGGLATADVLGVLGREGVHLANYWAYPPPNSPTYLAFKLLRNADGKGGGLGDLSLPVKSADPTTARLSCYAARDSKTGELTLLLINKMRKATVTAPVSLQGAAPSGPTRLHTFSAAAPGGIASAAGPSAAGGKITFTLPPYSATLARIPTGGTTR